MRSGGRYHEHHGKESKWMDVKETRGPSRDSGQCCSGTSAVESASAGIFSKGGRNRASDGAYRGSVYDGEINESRQVALGAEMWMEESSRLRQAGGSARLGAMAGELGQLERLPGVARAAGGSDTMAQMEVEVFLMEAGRRLTSNRVSFWILQADRSLEILWPARLAWMHG